jgi:four helix bundle protein
LRVYKDAITFVAWAEDFIQEVKGKVSAKDQLDRASTSVPLNIAEGNGKRSPRDRRRYLETACGSALECASCLDVLVAKRRLDHAAIQPGKELLHGIVSMLTGLIDRQSARVRV